MWFYILQFIRKNEDTYKNLALAFFGDSHVISEINKWYINKPPNVENHIKQKIRRKQIFHPCYAEFKNKVINNPRLIKFDAYLNGVERIIIKELCKYYGYIWVYPDTVVLSKHRCRKNDCYHVPHFLDEHKGHTFTLDYLKKKKVHFTRHHDCGGGLMFFEQIGANLYKIRNDTTYTGRHFGVAVNTRKQMYCIRAFFLLV